MNCLSRHESRVFYLSLVDVIIGQYLVNDFRDWFETVTCWCSGKSRIFPGWLSLSSQTKTCKLRIFRSLPSTPCKYASQSAFIQSIFIDYFMICFSLEESFAQNLFLMQVCDFTHFPAWCFATPSAKIKDWNKLWLC